MKPRAFNNFRLNGNGGLEFFDDDVYTEDHYSRVEVYIKLKNYNIRVGNVWMNGDNEKALEYIDSNLTALLGEKSAIDRVLVLLSTHSDYYEQMHDSILEGLSSL